MNSLYVT